MKWQQTLRSFSGTAAFVLETLPGVPAPTSTIQWYRAGSFALLLDGYDAGKQEMSPPTLPINLDIGFLDCVNTTIGATLPLQPVA